MNPFTLASVLAASVVVNGLHVTQWHDSMIINPGNYIELFNSNKQNFLSEAVDSKT